MKPTKIENKNGKKGKCGCGLLVIILLIIVSALVSGGYYLENKYEETLNNSLSQSDEIVTFVVVQGESVDQIIEGLVASEILNKTESQYLKIYLRLNSLGNTIQAGSFQVPKNLTMLELVETLQSAGIPEVWVTIPEGLRYDEIGEIINEEFLKHEEGSFSVERFLQLSEDSTYLGSLQLGTNLVNIEGFLFPDKYLIPLESSEEEIIQLMVNTFKEKVGSDYTYDDIIIASLLEREGRTDQERKMISDIISRRLKEGWFLNIDATLLYNFKDWEHELTKEDVETDYPYNTYTRIGLPPTPISNPGLGSIEAALSPTPNEFYYYLHDSDGIIHYAKTYEEHSANIYDYLQ